jgi:hypothetical protein
VSDHDLSCPLLFLCVQMGGSGSRDVWSTSLHQYHSPDSPEFRRLWQRSRTVDTDDQEPELYAPAYARAALRVDRKDAAAMKAADAYEREHNPARRLTALEFDWAAQCLSATGARTADVTFVVGAAHQRIHAHRIVLAARSPVFQRMFFGGAAGDSKGDSKEAVVPAGAELQVPDIEPMPFKVALQWYGLSCRCPVACADLPPPLLVSVQYVHGQGGIRRVDSCRRGSCRCAVRSVAIGAASAVVPARAHAPDCRHGMRCTRRGRWSEWTAALDGVRRHLFH